MAGIVGSLKRLKTKGKSETMAYLTLEDEEGSAEVIVFPGLYKGLSESSSVDNILVIKGTLDKTEKGLKILAKEISDLAQVLARNRSGRIEITVHSGIATEGHLRSLREIVETYRGDCPLYLRVEHGGLSVLLATCLYVDSSAAFAGKVEELAGKGTVKVA